ncbi:hypothetical protein LG324_12645 [Phycicoccus jejuensis]|uniref:hypothetical protein n=1 Tax=Phycicoccus jejuensis TaxID=367299 RepID=UPI00384FE1FD
MGTGEDDGTQESGDPPRVDDADVDRDGGPLLRDPPPPPGWTDPLEDSPLLRGAGSTSG